MYCSYLTILIILFLLIVGFLYYIIKNKNINTLSAMIDKKYDLGFANADEMYDKPFILQKFITPEKCNEIIAYSNGKLFDSQVIGGLHKNIRNSQQCWIPKTNPLVISMFERISQIFNIPFENAEDLQVVKYLPGQYYNEHHDSCCDNNEQCISFVKRGGQRKLTVLIYLNNNFEEGQTYFRNMDLKVKPPTGDALVFFPLAKNNNKCHPLALHAGMPVTSGEKWIANMWFRENKFS
jgi:prolyl 4-hydroxylase